MPTLDWLKKAFDHGYDSGNILSVVPDTTRAKEEKKIGGSYREVFFQAVLPYLKPDSKVLELGSGRGSWTRAILEYLPQGELHAVDFQDVAKWLNPEEYKGRLICHHVEDNSFACLENSYFDFFWSFGVLCHCNAEHIREILGNALPKIKPGGVAVHQYGDWEKLERYGWQKGGVPLSFKSQPDNDIWWPRNNQQTMSAIATATGWTVVTADLGLVKRDSIIVMKKKKFEDLYQAIANYTLLDAERIFSLWKLINDINRRGVKGDIVECGSYKGGSSAVLRAGMGPHRKLWMYDSFQGMPKTSEQDGDEARKWVGECAASVDEVLEILAATGASREEFVIREGWFQDTFKQALPEQVALLHCDADWYESVTLVLETFYPLMPSGACIILDDFGHWEGCRLAFYDFCEKYGERPLLERVGYTQAFWIKGKEHNRDG